MSEKRGPGGQQPNAGRPMSPLRKTFADRLDELGIDPVRELALIATHKDTPLSDKKDIYKDFLKYRYPTAKEIHTKVEGEGAFAEFMLWMASRSRPEPATAKKVGKTRKKPDEPS